MSTRPTLLIVDDTPSVRFTLVTLFEDDDYELLEAADGQTALDIVRARPVSLVITDVRMPPPDGFAVLDAIRAMPDGPPVVLITAHGDERMAVEAMRRGALDYFPKPFEPADVATVVHRSMRVAKLDAENKRLRADAILRRTMVFTSEAMSQVAHLVARVAPLEVTVLLTGESGTGKELVARALREASPRRSAPFVRINCAALPVELAEAELFGHARGAFSGADRARPGIFRQADGGTLFLDEVGEMAPAIQRKLLRALQEREVRPVGEVGGHPVDVRLIAATNADLAARVADGAFREDLYYRLKVICIEIPPLRDRLADVRPLVAHFTDRATHRFGFDHVELAPPLIDRLTHHPWPGNVRELAHAVESIVALGDGPVIDDLALVERVLGTGRAAPPPRLPDRLAAIERGIIIDTLRACAGNQSEAARRLGIGRATLIDKLKRYDLH
ncbi:MAG: sigma-54-dependent Fis family transcriptional regulator [Myxococcales bacterium]|nr:sigma-54-dependent Fis family transcriptional regulator [Myxococcales bacterium]